MYLRQVLLLSLTCQSWLNVRWYVPVKSQIGQSFLGTNCAILLLIMSRKLLYRKLFLVTLQVRLIYMKFVTTLQNYMVVSLI